MILTHIIQIIVLSPNSNTFLVVGDPLIRSHLSFCVSSAQEQRLKLEGDMWFNYQVIISDVFNQFLIFIF